MIDILFGVGLALYTILVCWLSYNWGKYNAHKKGA
jgi:hypothetical protein